MTIEERTLKIARETAKTAGQRILPLFGKVSKIKEKESPTDICSEADLLAEKIIFSRLSPEFPDFNYLSEERQFIDKGSRYTWIIDPLDGSVAFASGLEYWGISIGLLRKTQPVVGVVYIPGKNWLFAARKGKGAFLNGRKTRVSKNKEYDKALIGFDLGHRGLRRKDLLNDIASQVDNVRYMPSFACCTFGQVLVAAGVYDAYLHHRAFIWDFCAGVIIVQEAGGKVTNLQGKPLDWTKKENISAIISNGLLHQQILEKVLHIS